MQKEKYHCMGLVWGRQATEMNIGINLHLDIVESLQASKEVEKKVDVQSGNTSHLQLLDKEISEQSWKGYAVLCPRKGFNC